MLYNFQRKKLCRHLLVGGALFAAGLGMFSCSDTYDLDSEQPSNLNSIYGYMKDQGKFTNTLHLIYDLGETEVLSKTGSKTMFIADDDAFAKFYASNSWGVKSYADLSPAQKKLLLYSAMIDNPYSTSMLSTAEGPVKGEVCRRSSSLTLFDSVFFVKVKDPKETAKVEALPANDRFREILANHDSIVLFTDASNAAPMIHFNYKFVAANKLQDTDIDFLYNDKPGTRRADDVYVNNAKVINANIFCKNGFIHQVDRVILPLDNMAEIIRKDKETSIYSSIIERFAAPDYSRTLTDQYNNVYRTDVDSVFNKRYFSDRSAGSTGSSTVAFSTDKDNGTFDAALAYDPGWNGYCAYSGEGRDAMKEDMAVMLVPTDEAMLDWWENKSGKDIKDFYKTIDETPNSVLDDLIRVNQLSNLTKSVPSHFNLILDQSTQNALGIEPKDVKEVILGCNGAVYKTNRVFAPASYSSVLFPAVVDTTNFRIIEHAISCLDYDKYLNAMETHYIFLLPTNEGMLSYVDPVSYGQTTSQMWQFHYDPTKARESRIWAEIFKCELNSTTGKWEKGDYVTKIENRPIIQLVQGAWVPKTSEILCNRLMNLLDNIIVTTAYDAGQTYYKTKANTFVRVEGFKEGSKVYGSFQSERDYPLNVTKYYEKENGYTLVVDGPVMGTRNSVAMRLNEHDEFSEFLWLLQESGAISNGSAQYNMAAAATQKGLGNLINIKDWETVGAEDKPASVDKNKNKKVTFILNKYHYTVYAPTNKALEEARNAGYKIPSYDDLVAAEEWDEYVKENEIPNAITDSAARVREVMLDFVKYHIHENSLYVDGAGFESGQYESTKTELIASVNVAEGVSVDNSAGNANTFVEGDSIYIKEKTTYNKFLIKAKEFDEEGKYTVQYYTGKYSPGRPYRLKVDTNGGLTVTDNVGNVRHVLTSDPELYNIQAAEYWISKGETTSSSEMSVTANPYEYHLNNSSSVVVHAIDGPLIYADGKHKDANGEIVPTQFIYKYKPLTQDAGANLR